LSCSRAAAAIFHFANGSLLLLVAQKLALAHPGYETGLTSAAITITQLATIPMGLLVTRANAFGRKPLLIIAFATVPLRGLPTPELVIVDGAPGLEKALAALWPDTAGRHKTQ
jgi:hypothetical protein